MHIIKYANMVLLEALLKLGAVELVNWCRNGFRRKDNVIFTAELVRQFVTRDAVEHRARLALMTCANKQKFLRLFAIGRHRNLIPEWRLAYCLCSRNIFMQAATDEDNFTVQAPPKFYNRLQTRDMRRERCYYHALLAIVCREKN